jgi:hypothetical protein
MPIPCARCDAPLPTWELSAAGVAACTSCGSRNTVSLFPAMFAAAHQAARPEVALDGEAACFDHPGKRAVAACHQCGRFVCRLCSVELGTEVWCPSCVAMGSGPAKAAHLDTSCTLYDSIAFITPIASLIILYPITILTAPATLVFSLVKWKQPLSLVRRNRWRLVVAILVSFSEAGLWLWLLIYWMVRLRAGQ